MGIGGQWKLGFEEREIEKDNEGEGKDCESYVLLV